MTPDDPPPALYRAINHWSGELGGRDLRFTLGPAGQPRLPPVGPPANPAARERLARTLVILLPGGPWPGVADNGAAWVGPWSEALRAAGVGQVVSFPPLRGMTPLNAGLAPVWNTLTGSLDRPILHSVLGYIQKRPLAPGARIVLLGHSVGGVMACRLVEGLAQRGIPVHGLVLLETHLPHSGTFFDRLPAVPRAWIAENELGFWPRCAPETTLTRAWWPSLRHMDMVLRPPTAFLAAILAALASPDG